MSKILPDNRLILIVAILVAIAIPIFGKYREARRESSNDMSPIEQDLIKEIDVTGDGKPEKIVLHLSAKNIKFPFTWTLTITSEGKKIFSHQGHDAQLDKFFNDEGYVLDCKDYISCKKKYYYHDLLNGFVLTGNKWYDLEGILNKELPTTLYPLGRKQLKACCNITGAHAESILNKIETNFRSGKVIALVVPESPVHAKPPLVFVPEIERFIEFYRE
jgi:hypothetical protein